MTSSPKASAYLSILDDWTMLPHVLPRIAGRVDEIVVVDGAYDWMAPFLQAEGRDPTLSDPRMEQVLAPYAGKLRIIRGTWRNELEKRVAGYAACSHRFIWRIDADEILHIDDAALERYWESDLPVAEMDMPMLVAPGWMRRHDGAARIERQAVLFDRMQIGPRDHLAYLWLVLSAAERATLRGTKPADYFADPVAFNAHLTSWRPPETAIGRARFYLFNHYRGGTAPPWAPGFHYSEAEGFLPLCRQLPPATIADMLVGHRIVVGAVDMEGCGLKPVPLPAGLQAEYAPLWDDFLAGLAAANRALADAWREVPAGDAHNLDMTTEAARAPLVVEGAVQLIFAQPMRKVTALLHRYIDRAPWVERIDLAVALASDTARLHSPPQGQGVLRDILQINAWPAEATPFYRMRGGR